MKSIKKVLIGMALMLGLTLLSMTSQTVHADGSGMPSASGNGQASGQGTTQTGEGGALSTRTGFFVTVSVADSETGPSHAIGDGCVMLCQGAQNPQGSFSPDAETRISGGHASTRGTAPWPYPAFLADKNNPVGYGENVKRWLLADSMTSDGSLNCYYVAEQYCHVTPEQIRGYFAQNKVVFLNVEPFMWCRNFTNTYHSSMGPWIMGLTYGIGSKITNDPTWVSSVTRGAFPKAFRYERNWQGISDCNIGSNTFSREMMMDKSIGCGIVSVKMNDSYQVVICVEDDAGNWNTEYLGSGPEYNILSTYQGCEFVEATFSTKKSNLTSPTASYGAVCSSGAPNRGVGTGMQQFHATELETALFIHYKGDLPEPDTMDADLYAHEVAYLMPKYAAERADGAEVDNEYTLEDHINEKIEQIEQKTKSCPHNDDYEHANNASGSAIIDKVTCRDSEDWANQYTGVKANLGEFPHASWNLYRESVSGEKWDVFDSALNDVDRWKINEPVDPQFSYYLTRSHLENVAISPDRDEGLQELCAELNIEPRYTWESSYTGAQGQAQQANTTGAYDVDEYEYKFTFYGYELKIYYHFECGGDYWEKKEEGDWDNDPSTPDTEEVVDSETHEEGHAYNASGDDWGSVDDSTIYEENSYTPDAFKGATGGHAEEKFKTKPTPSGQSTEAGNVIGDRTVGETHRFNFVKGTPVSYTAYTGELVASQFQGVSFTIYPEVAMTIWESASAEEYIDPVEEICYVMGEYPRHYTPPIAHSYICSLPGGRMEGIGSLATPAVGSAASQVPSYNLGVTAMGTTFEVATKSRYEIDIYTVGCTVEEHEANDEWGNTPTDVAGSHEEYVSSIMAGMHQELIMEMTSDKFDNADKEYAYLLLATEGEATRSDHNESTSIFWHSGGYDEEDTVQGWCDEMWGPEAYTEALQYTPDKILDTMFVSCTDDDDENASHMYDPHDHNGEALGELLDHGAHWYDEESKGKMRVEFYHTHIVFGLLNADDKVDYNLLTQSAWSRLIGQTDNIHVTFWTRLGNDQDYTAADGYTWDGHTGTYMLNQVQGTDFSIINQTTSQMKSN